jgi:hypothetical protein
MKMSVKSIILTSVLGLGLSVGFTQLLNKKQQEEEVNKVAEYKNKSREKIKPHKYDGSKITYFNYLTYDQKKTLEVLMYNGIEYKFCFNTEGVPKGIDIVIYDKDEAAQQRIKLYEAKGVMNKDVIVTSDEMLKALQAEKKGVTSLKKVFIEYVVPIGDKPVEAAPKESNKKGEPAPANPMARGVVVVSFGYKNI